MRKMDGKWMKNGQKWMENDTIWSKSGTNWNIMIRKVIRKKRKMVKFDTNYHKIAKNNEIKQSM